jgi:hypothetical protein
MIFTSKHILKSEANAFEIQEKWNRVELDHRRNKVMHKRMFEEGITFTERLLIMARNRLQVSQSNYFFIKFGLFQE